MKLDKYKQNLDVRQADNGEYKVYSYGTHAATFKRGEAMVQMGYWSMTTQKHINYVATQFGIATILKDY